MVQVVKDVVTWLKQWFYTKDDLTPMLNAKANKNLTNANQNVVTDASGDITTEPKPTIPTDVSDLSDTTNKQFTPKSHNQATSTITNSTAFNNIKSGESTTLTLNTQAKINSAIDSKIGTLSSIEVIKVVDSKPTASASTLNKLYIVSENNKVNVYYTKQSGSSYSWQKMDTDILDELSISWGDITDKPSFEATATNIKMNGTQSVGSLNTFARGDHIHPTDTSRAASNHTHDYSSTYAAKTHTHASGDVTGLTASKNVVTGSDGKLTTENKPTIPTGSSTATDIKMNGTQSAGTSSNFAKADHVHPTDTSRASSTHVHGNLQTNGQVGATAQANKNVVTDSYGKITTEDKPTIPSVTGKADKTAAIGTTITLVDKGETNEGCIIFNTIS